MRLIALLLCLGFLMNEAHAVQAQAEDYQDKPYAELAILDKITARVKQVVLTIGEDYAEARLRLRIERCADTPPEFAPESVAFVQVQEQKQQELTAVFRGWMFASSPGLSAVEHPVYDVWLIACHLERPMTEIN